MIGTRDKTIRSPKRDLHDGSGGTWDERGPGIGGSPRPRDPHDGGGGLGPKGWKKPNKGF